MKGHILTAMERVAFWHIGLDYHSPTFGMPGDAPPSEGPHQWQLGDHIPSDLGWRDDQAGNVPFEARSGKWYHSSPRLLKPGDQITPSGMNNPSDIHPEFYGYGNYNRRNYVWLSSTLDDANWWADNWTGPYVYEVDPGDTPQQFNLQRGEGWVAPHANVIRQVDYRPFDLYKDHHNHD